MSDKTTETTAAQEEKYLVARLRRAAKQHEDVLTLLTVRGDLAEANVALVQDVERLRAERGTLEEQQAAQAAALAAWEQGQKDKILATLARQQQEIERRDGVIAEQVAREAALDQRLATKAAEYRRVEALVDAMNASLAGAAAHA